MMETRAAARWTPSGVIALLTDFGLVDPYVGQLKAVLAARAPAARVIDLTHGVPPQAVEVASFLLRRSLAYFPPGSVHVAVVDPGVGSARALLVACDAGQAFLAPDNGLLPAALSAEARYFELDVARFALPGASRTFHGRDVLAPAAAALATGLAPWDAGPALQRAPVAGRVARARVERDTIEARVLFVDHYGNAVLDAAAEDLGGAPAAWIAEVGARRLALRGTYADGRSGEPLALVDSFGSVEIAVRDGSAAVVLGLAPGDPVRLRRIPC